MEDDADVTVPVSVVLAVTSGPDPSDVVLPVPTSTTRQNGTSTPFPTSIANMELFGP